MSTPGESKGRHVSGGSAQGRAEQRIGSLLKDKYRLDRVLGVGGMAVVYTATHRNQKQFAVKVLHPELSWVDDIRTRFLREGYVANSVKHPGTVSVLDDDVTEDGSAFLVMELLDGDAQSRSLEITLKPDESGLPLLFWVGGGALAAAGLGVGAYFVFRKPATAASPAVGTVSPGTIQLPLGGSF
jgi:hypothetical protein